MTSTIATLKEAARAYVRAVIELLAKECPEGPSRVAVGRLEWIRTSPNTFVLHNREEPYWADGLFLHRDRLLSLGEYAELTAALGRDPTIAPQLNTLVGTPLSAQSLDAERIANHLVWETAPKSGPLHFDDGLFDSAWQTVDMDLRKSEFGFALVAPIWEAKIPPLPIQLSSNVEIDALTDPEIIRCLNAGQFPEPMFGGTVYIHSSIGVRIRFQLPKRVGTGDLEQLNAAIAVYEQKSEELRRVLHVLRLFKAGRIAAPGFVVYSENWPVAGGTTSHAGEVVAARQNAYEMSPEDIQTLKELWDDVQKAEAKKKFLAAAIRRFGYAGERHRPEDKLVDLMIAAESFFLSDAGDPAGRGELSYRMAMRFAFFAAAAGYTRRYLFQQMRRAYQARSSIVHDGDLKKSDLRSKDADLTLKEFVALTEERLQGALKCGVKKAAHDDPEFGRWEDEILR
jgi:hypothetical protein